LFLPDGTFLPARAAVATVDVAVQRMEVAIGETPIATYLVSTARAGLGAEEGSGKTPPGWHRVVARYGAHAPPGQVFVSRRAVAGRIVSPSHWRADGAADLILSRIFRLDGLEPGVNRGGCVDSFARYIYLHGTNQEHLLGHPASHGCIRMANVDIIDLFGRVRGRPFYVNIVPSRD
jgi:UDP-N-acetylmuramate--alanine ligase